MRAMCCMIPESGGDEAFLHHEGVQGQDLRKNEATLHYFFRHRPCYTIADVRKKPRDICLANTSVLFPVQRDSATDVSQKRIFPSHLQFVPIVYKN